VVVSVEDGIEQMNRAQALQNLQMDGRPVLEWGNTLRALRNEDGLV